MLEQLKNVSEAIDALLASDGFPKKIRPEYLRSATLDYPLNGGKRLRPAVLIWCCEMLGGTQERALYPAAAAEVCHNWTLVHDDIIDQDAIRRNRPACHASLASEVRARFGLSEEEGARAGRDFAILTGDVQQGWANDLLLRAVEHGVSSKVAIGLMRRFQELTNRALISGEALDIEFSLRPIESIELDEVREMLMGKTGALLRFCAEAGAMIALETDDAEMPEVKKLGEFALAAGNAFQLRDDYLGIFGEFKQLGKPIGGDLRERKATLLLLSTLQKAGAVARAQLLQMLGLREYTQHDLDIVRDIMTDSGATESLNCEMRTLADKARGILNGFPRNKFRDCLLELVDYLTTREK